MRRSVTVLLGQSLFLLLLGLIAGCGKGNVPAGTGVVSSVTLAPANVSLDPGGVAQMSATPVDAAGAGVAGQTVTFSSSNGAIQIANNGLLCAGTWDSLTAPVVCTPVASVPATSQIKATAGSISSTASNVFVHLHVDSITVTPPSPAPACESQTGVEIFSAHAFTNTATFNGVPNSCGGTTPCDITPSVGPFSWATGDPNVATIVLDPNNDTQGDATAKNPGLTNVIASAGGTTGTPGLFTTCGPRSIVISVSGQPTQFSFTIATSATQALAATVTDTQGFVLTSPPLTWSSSSAFVASVNGSGTVTGREPGISTIVASCSPPTCNNVVNQPIYSNPVQATVTGTAVSQFVYVSSTQFATTLPGCNNGGAATNCTSAIPIQTSSNTAGTAITLPSNQLPNSIGSDSGGSSLLMGSTAGLMQVNAAGQSFSQTFTTLPGTLLAISPNGTVLAVNPATSTVETLNLSSGVQKNAHLTSATAADWTPDSYKAYIVSGTSLFDFPPSLSLQTVTSSLPGAASGVAFLATGAYGYVASGPTDLTAFISCNDSQQSQVTTLPAAPAAIRAVPGGTQLAVADLSNLNVVTATPAAASGCPTGVSETVTTIPLGITYGAIHQLLVTPDGTKAVVLGDKGVTIVALSGSPAPANVALGGATAFTGGITNDSATLYVGASDFKVHIVNLGTAVDTQQIAISFPNQTAPVVPDLVNVVP